MDNDLTQRIVSASSAPPVETNAPNSVFALGGAPGLPSITLKPRSDSTWPQVLHLIQERGPMSVAQIAVATGMTEERVHKSLLRLRAHNAVGVASSHRPCAGHPLLYDLTHRCPEAPSGFKTWLAKRGDQSAEGRASVQPAPEPDTSPEPRVLTGHGRGRRAIARIDPVPGPQLTCGLLNTGELLIEEGEQHMRLNRGQAQALVAYLDLVADTLKAI